jgi:hypothetical protein
MELFEKNSIEELTRTAIEIFGEDKKNEALLNRIYREIGRADY